MKSEFKIQFDSESDFESETIKQMLEGPRWKEVVVNTFEYLENTPFPPDVRPFIALIVQGIETQLKKRKLNHER